MDKKQVIFFPLPPTFWLGLFGGWEESGLLFLYQWKAEKLQTSGKYTCSQEENELMTKNLSSKLGTCMLLLPVLQRRWDLWIFPHLFQRCPTSAFSTAREPGGWLPSVTGSWSFHRPTPSGISPPFPLLPLIKACNTSFLLSPYAPIQYTLPQQPEWLCYCSAYNPSRLFCIWHKSHNPHPGSQGSPWGDFSLLSTLSLWSPPSLGAQCSRGTCALSSPIHPQQHFWKVIPMPAPGCTLTPRLSTIPLLSRASMASSCFLLGSHNGSHL